MRQIDMDRDNIVFLKQEYEHFQKRHAIRINEPEWRNFLFCVIAQIQTWQNEYITDYETTYGEKVPAKYRI